MENKILIDEKIFSNKIVKITIEQVPYNVFGYEYDDKDFICEGHTYEKKSAEQVLTEMLKAAFRKKVIK